MKRKWTAEQIVDGLITMTPEDMRAAMSILRQIENHTDGDWVAEWATTDVTFEAIHEALIARIGKLQAMNDALLADAGKTD
jgi:hypothetical protein